MSLPLPDLDGAKSYILSVETENRSLGARAERYDHPLWVDGLHSQTNLTVLIYDAELESLGLSPGAIAPPSDCARSCALLTPARTLRAVSDGEGRILGNGWSENHGVILEPLATTILGPGRCGRRGCLAYDVEEIEAPVDIRTVLPDGPSSVLLGGSSGDAYRLSVDGQIEMVCGPSGELVRVASRPDGGGRVWVAGDGWSGEIRLSGAFATGPCLVEHRVTLPEGGQARGIAGSADPSSHEVFVLTDDTAQEHLEAVLFRVDGDSATEVARRPLNMRDAGDGHGMQSGSVVYLGPGRAAAVFGSNEVLWLDAAKGELRIDALPPAAAMLTIVWSDVFGLVGTWVDQFLVWRGPSFRSSTSEGGEWLPMAPVPGAGKPYVVLPNGRRISLTWEGAMGEYVEGLEYCPPKALFFAANSFSPRTGARFGESAAWVIGRLPNPRTLILIRPPELVCGDEND